MISRKTISFPKKFISYLTIIGLCLSILTGICPSYVYADGQAVTQEELREAERKEQLAKRYAQQKTEIINDFYKNMPDFFMQPTIVTPTEMMELDMGKLIGISGAPITEIGRAGLGWLSIPVTSYPEIYRRQNIIRNLVQDEAPFNQIGSALRAVKKAEDRFIEYRLDYYPELHWYIKNNVLPKTTKLEEPKDATWAGQKRYEMAKAMRADKLHANRNEMYTSVPALELAAASPFLNMVGLSLSAYLSMVFYTMSWKPMKDWLNPAVLKETCTPNAEMFKEMFKKTVEDLWTPMDPRDRMRAADGTYKVWDHAGEFWEQKDLPVSQMGYMHLLQVPYSGSAADRFAFGRDYVEQTMPNVASRYPIAKDIAGGGLAIGMALRYYLYMWGGFQVCKIWKDGKELINRMHELHVSLVEVAHAMRAMSDLYLMTTKNPIFRGSHAHQALTSMFGPKAKVSKECKELMELLKAETFNNANSQVYSRGRVLRAHILMEKVSAELTPLFQAVAELDGYFSIARMMKAYENKEHKFVFAQFVTSDAPRINISSCWEPLAPTKNPVVNDVLLGAQGKPIRMIITGPNGGGKSTFLKSVGHAVVMAQSWGIVPANKAEMTMFNAIRTSLDPKEDLSAGISKFTAQKERIGKIGQMMQHTNTANKMLVILDEPFTGTIDDQMADRVHQFGDQASRVPHTALCIATHVKKPTELAKNGSFANYQIEILEPSVGNFVRTFKIKEGAAQWWFNDKARVTRFIDNIDADAMRKKAQGQGMVKAVVEGAVGKKPAGQPGISAGMM